MPVISRAADLASGENSYRRLDVAVIMLAHLDRNLSLPVTTAASKAAGLYRRSLKGPLPVWEPYFNDPLRRSARAGSTTLDLPGIIHLAQYFASLPRG